MRQALILALLLASPSVWAERTKWVTSPGVQLGSRLTSNYDSQFKVSRYTLQTSAGRLMFAINRYNNIGIYHNGSAQVPDKTLAPFKKRVEREAKAARAAGNTRRAKALEDTANLVQWRLSDLENRAKGIYSYY